MGASSLGGGWGRKVSGTTGVCGDVCLNCRKCVTTSVGLKWASSGRGHSSIQGTPLRNEVEAIDPSRLGEATAVAAEGIGNQFGRTDTAKKASLKDASPGVGRVRLLP